MNFKNQTKAVYPWGGIQRYHNLMMRGNEDERKFE